MIKTDKLTKIYSSGTKALDNLSIHVKEGEIFGFLGPNGAGKSTAIKILTTLSRPTSGMAWVCGYNVLNDPGKVRCSIGYVAQETGVDYCLSGRENLVLQGRLYRMDNKVIKNRVEELMGLFDIKESADALVSTYSGGMRRKLDIATALIHNPKILFLDEPTIGLDPHSRSSLWNYIRMLNKDLRVTIFLTTHYLDEADKLSHRIGILHKGSMKIVDTPEALKDSIKGDSVNLSLNEGVERGGIKDKAIAILKGNPMVKDLLCEDSHVRVYVNNGSEAIPGLMKLLDQHGIEVLSLTISRPSLDDVYLKYSGVSFKEGESSEGSNPWWAQWQKGGWGKNWKGGEEWKEEGGKDWKGGGEWNQERGQEWKGEDKGDGGKVIPAQAGIQNDGNRLDSCFRRNDDESGIFSDETYTGLRPTKDNENVVARFIGPGFSDEKEDGAWSSWDKKVEGECDNKIEESPDKDKKEEDAWKKWGNEADWGKWGKGGGKG